MDQPPASVVGCCVGLCQGFARVLDMVQILFREICFCRKAVLLYPEGFTQIALIGLFSLRNSVNPYIRWEDIGDGLKNSPLVWRVHRGPFLVVPQFSSIFSRSEEPVCCVCCRDWPFLMVPE